MEEVVFEDKYKRPVLRTTRVWMLGAYHFALSSLLGALSVFIVPRVAYASAARGHAAESSAMLWLSTAVVHLVSSPLFASLSDRRPSRSFGRRRPYVAVGTVLAAASLLTLSIGGLSIPISWYALLLAVLSLGISCSHAAWQGLCADIVRREQAPSVVVSREAFECAGFLFGAGLLSSIGELIRVPTVYALLLVCLAACNLCLFVFDEPTRFPPPPPFRLKTMWADLLEPLQASRDFRLLFLARCSSESASVVFRYLALFFYADAVPKYPFFGVSIASAVVATGVSMAIAGAAGAAGKAYAMLLVPHTGHKAVLYTSGVIMSAAMFTFTLFQTSYTAALAASAAFGFGLAAWSASMNGVAGEVMPASVVDERPLGVWWLANDLAVLVVLTPIGAVVDYFKRGNAAYTGHAIAHGTAAAFLLLSTLLVVFVSKGQKRRDVRLSGTRADDNEIWSTT